MKQLVWDDEAAPVNLEEEVLLAPLLALLRRHRWVGPKTSMRSEFPWNGRRIDFAYLSPTGITSAFEMKLSSFQRVLEQAIYNRLSFDRSWVVVANTPRSENLDLAREYGIGVMALQDQLRILVMPENQPRQNRTIRTRLTGKLKDERSTTGVR